MNKKGIFSAIVAIAAIITVAAVIVSASAPAVSAENNNYAETVLKTKKDWSNLRYLLDKALSDALADSVDIGSCTFMQSNIKITNYLNDAKDSSFSECGFTVPQISGPQDNLLVTLTISCSKTANRFTASFQKQAEFRKAIVSGGSPCNITVTDLQSGQTEIDWTAP